MAQLLIAEDDELLRDALQTQLTQAGHAVAVAEDGQVALDMMTHSAYDALVLDLGLPKVDGLDVLKIVKDDPSLQSIPIIILTTSDAESDIARAYSCKANSYLVKPVDFYKFADLLKTIGYYWLAWNQNPHLN